MTLRGKTLLITGSSRGIGLSIGLRAARDGANVAILAKTSDPHPKLPGTIHSAAEAIRQAGGQALAIQCDIRFEDQIAAAVAQTVEAFGGIDICVNNASAISMTPTVDTQAKKFDLMFGVNVRGTFLTSQACIPHLAKSKNAHILNISPPLSMKPHWFAPHVAYTMSKYGMSMCVLGMAEELKEQGIAVNALWPRTAIATAAIANVVAPGTESHCRKPEIMGDAAHWIFNQPSQSLTGQFLVDEDVLLKAGVSDLMPYAMDPSKDLLPDFFLD